MVGTKTFYKRKIGENAEVDKYKYRLIAQGFRQVKNLHHQETFPLMPAATSIRMVLATAAGKNWKLRHVDVDQALMQANVDEDIYVELLEDCQQFQGAVGG